MNDWWGRQAFWWVPILVTLVGGFGWLIKYRVEVSRTPGSIVAFTEKPLAYPIDVRLDDREISKARGGQVRFDNVFPGYHQLEFSSDDRQTSFRRVRAKGGDEVAVLIPELVPISGATLSKRISDVPQATTTDDYQYWDRVPGHSRLQVAIDRGQESLVFFAASIMSKDVSTSWSNKDVYPGPAELVLRPGTTYRLYLHVVFFQPGRVTIRARILGSEGSLVGREAITRLSGEEHSKKDAFFVINTAGV